MKYLFVFIISLSAYIINAQNIGINNLNPESALDINGDVTLRSADLTFVNGDNYSIDVGSNAFSNYRIIGPTADFSLSGFTSSTDGRMVSLLNSTGFNLTLKNEDVAENAAMRIVLDNGTTFVIPNNGSANFQYDGTLQRWVLKSHSVTSIASASSNSWTTSGNSNVQATSFIGSINNEPVIIKSGNNSVALFQHGFPSNNYIGTNYQRTGVGILGSSAPTHTLEIGLADLAGGSEGVLGIKGTQFNTHFNYGQEEHTYIRAGKSGGKIILNDQPGQGNVGIGKQFPQYKFDVNGDGGFYKTGAINYSEAQGSYYFGDAGLHISNPNLENYPAGIENNTIALDGKQIQAFVRNIDDPSFSDYARSIRINPFGGNVGIGTNFNPEYKMHIFSSDEKSIKIDGQNSLVLFHDNVSNAQYGFMRSWSNAPFNPAGYHGLEIGVPPSIGGDPVKKLMFSTNYNLRMVISENGNIGIGINNPQEKLAVNGTIRSKEVVVENINWPDYVFEDTYQKIDLEKLDDYIKKNKKLPNIPSAKEVMTNGQNMGELQRLMMEKIEELTLYIIDQDKKIKALETSLQKLEKR